MSEEQKKLTPDEELQQNIAVIPDGTQVEINGRLGEVKTFVRRRFAGEDVVSRTIEMKAASDTVYIDREFADDWKNDKDYIIDMLEGKYVKQEDGTMLPVIVGFKQMCNFALLFRKHLTVDPLYKQFFDSIVGDKLRKFLDNYRLHPEMMDIKLGERLWMEAILEKIEIRLVELDQELAVNQIDARSYANAKALMIDRCKPAVIKYLSGELSIDDKTKKPYDQLTEAEKRKFMDEVVAANVRPVEKKIII